MNPLGDGTMSTAPTNPALTDGPGSKRSGAEYYWLWVLCLLGLDYFSTLAYQPSITFHETGDLGPLATAVVVLVTLFGALPVYCYLAGRSPGGQGSLGVVEHLIHGWRGKTLVLILLGFAATDFTMLKSLSLADASVHVLNGHVQERRASAHQFAGWLQGCAADYCGPAVKPYINEQLVGTIVLGIVSFVFWFVLRKGFNRNVMFLAVPLVALYLALTGMLIAGGGWILWEHPEIVTDWLNRVQHGNAHFPGVNHDFEGWGTVALLSLLALPNLALGLSGFELSMILMPQVQGKPGEQPPATRIWNTRKVLIAAAAIMAVYLLGSVLVTTLLIPPAQFSDPGFANNRALAYLAHGGQLSCVQEETLLPICGTIFGTLYDIVTVLILCLAGTSVITALAVLLPMFLLRFGMEFRWSNKWGVLLMLFAGINMFVTFLFKADVEDQRGAYATGVLVLIACASVVTVVEKKRGYDHQTGFWRFVAAFGVGIYSLIAIIFVATMLAVAVRSWSGMGISLCFILAILGMSICSRAWRADELRTIGFDFKDDQSKFLWDSLRLADFPILVPVRPGKHTHDEKEECIRTQHQLAPDADIVLLEICIDDPSDFFQRLLIEVQQDGNRYVIRVTNGVSTPHAIAAIALEMSRYSKPPGVHFGWPEMDMLTASWSYLAFGEGNIPWKVRELIQRAERDPAKRPRVIVG
jgi:hypothetical protein